MVNVVAGTSAMVKGCPVVKKPQPMFDPSADTPINLPGLRRSIGPKWSNGWSWEGPSFKAKVFLNVSNNRSLILLKIKRYLASDFLEHALSSHFSEVKQITSFIK